MDDIVDLERFPSDQPHSAAWTKLVADCQADLRDTGMFNLTGFLPPDVVQREAASFAPRFAKESFLHEREHNIYFLKSVPGLSPDHLALQRFKTSNNTICGDQIAGSALLRLYNWPRFAEFLAATRGVPALYPMDDDMSRLNVMSYNEGQTLNWHFDRSEFTTTLLLQKPDMGGAFEYRTDLRSDDDPNYDGVARLLAGEDDKVRLTDVDAGTLTVFKGKNTAHRVTEVQGPNPRIIAVLSYYETEGVRFSQDERIGFYGRAS